MRKHHIIVILALVVAAGALAAVYFFYFRELLLQYSKDEEHRDKLDKRLTELEGEFANCQPEAILRIWAGAIQPWADAVERRSNFFALPRDIIELEPIPEDRMSTVKFYYEEKRNGLLYALQQDAWNQYGTMLPYNGFGTPEMTELTNASVNPWDVAVWLQRVKIGCHATRRVLKAKPLAINRIVLWWPPTPLFGVQIYTVGVNCTMTLDGLARFLDLVSRDEIQYCAFNEIRIDSPYLRAYQDPPLVVSFLFSLASYAQPPPGAPVPAAGAPSGTAAQFEALKQRRQSALGTPAKEEPKSFWQKIWPFSKREPRAPSRQLKRIGVPDATPAAEGTADANPQREGGM